MLVGIIASTTLLGFFAAPAFAPNGAWCDPERYLAGSG
jgi:hypothetical protein